ncbi:MAG: c-type cytochrome, partial [Silicimonas sp.]|nr:c-type cytochrome [Silicimonas sp.]
MKRIVIALALAANPAMAEPDARAGQGVFFTNCAGCHGPDARGAGPVAKLLSVSPPDLTLLASENGGIF